MRLKGNPKTYVDLIMTKERIDTTTSGLLEGKVVVFVEETPYAIIALALFFDFFQTPDDYHLKSGRLISRFIRFVSFCISVIIAPLYVTAEKYKHDVFSKEHQELLFHKDELLPTFWEIAILLILFRIFVDIGMRAPKR